MYFGELAVGEIAAGGGCSSARSTSSSGVINFGSCGIMGNPSTLGDPMSDRSSNGIDTSESSKDEADDEEEDVEEEEEENLALADSIPSPPVHRITAKISIPVQAPTPFWSKVEIDRLLAIPSPLSPLSSPLRQILSPPLPVSPHLPVSSPPLPASCTYPLGYRAATIQLRAETPSTSHPLPSITLPSGTPPLLLIPLPTSSSPLLLSFTSHKVDVPKVTLPPRKRLCIALGSRFEVGESSSAPTAKPTRGFRAYYGFVGNFNYEIRQEPKREVETEVARLLVIPTPPPSPLSLWLRVEAPSTSHPLPLSTPPLGTLPLLPIPLPTSSPPLLLLSTNHRVDVPEVTLPLWKRLCIALGPRFEVGENSSALTARPTEGFRADYGFIGTLDDEIRRDPER
nr:hypothetical protein [Tanacetum cinerariifolium]